VQGYWTVIEQCPGALETLTCIGFESPMDRIPVKVHKNRALPLKAQLVVDQGSIITDLNIIAPPVIQVLYESGSNGTPVDVTESALPVGEGTEGNQFVFTEEGKWQYNLKTKNYSASGTYSITMESGDNNEYLIDPTCSTSFMIE
jgi:hypothetical protein